VIKNNPRRELTMNTYFRDGKDGNSQKGKRLFRWLTRFTKDRLRSNWEKGAFAILLQLTKKRKRGINCKREGACRLYQKGTPRNRIGETEYAALRTLSSRRERKDQDEEGGLPSLEGWNPPPKTR